MEPVEINELLGFIGAYLMQYKGWLYAFIFISLFAIFLEWIRSHNG